MGSGARQERISYGAASGEAQAIQEHELAMIPIIEKRAETERILQAEMFEQQYGQAERLYLLPDLISQKLAESERQRLLDLPLAEQLITDEPISEQPETEIAPAAQPVFMPSPPAAAGLSGNMIYRIAAAAIYFLFLRK